MKKFFLSLLTCSLFAVAANAQLVQSESYYGAEKGDFAITIGADPVINFVGNMFNGTQDNKLSGIGASLAGKYHLGNQLALKAGVRIDNSKKKSFTYNPEDEDYKDIIRESTEGSKEFQISLGAQYNFRSGNRLQPFVAADIVYGRTNANYSVTEQFDAEYYNVSLYDQYRKTASPVNTFGFIANIGIEYFLGKKISVSAALDLGVYTSVHRNISKFETEDNKISSDDIDANNYNKKTSKETRFGTGLLNGNIAFNFYF